MNSQVIISLKDTNPDELAFYCSANIVIRSLSDKYHSRLTSLLRSSYFEKPRKTGLGKFLDKSKTRAAGQSIQYHLDHIRLISQPWNNENLSIFFISKVISTLNLQTQFATLQEVTI